MALFDEEIIEMISVIMPFYNRWDLTHQRIMEIHKFMGSDIDLILINDASTETDCEGGIAFWQRADTRQEIRYAKNKKNLGFGGSMNRGAKMAKGDILVFLSNDVVISNNFMPEITNRIEENEDILIGGRIVYWDSGWNCFTINGKKTIFSYCEGWLLACTRKVWDNLGGFDPRFAPYDYEDVDLSTIAISKGYKLVGLNSPHLHHLAGQTAKYDEKRLQITNRNKQLFFEKWKDKANF